MNRFSLSLGTLICLGALAVLALIGFNSSSLSVAAPAPVAAAAVAPDYCDNYTYSTSGGATIVPGTQDIGNHTDDGDTPITLPFPVQVYSQTFSVVNISSNGRLDFGAANDPGGYTNVCLPALPGSGGPFDFTLFPQWDDLDTTQGLPGCPALGGACGIFTSITGSAPDRVFNIEWRAVYHTATDQPANFEVRLYESQARFDFIYGNVGQAGSSATIGVQGSLTLYNQYSCDTGGLTSGLEITWTLQSCTDTPTPTTQPTRTATATATTTPSGSPTPPLAAGPLAAGPGDQQDADIDGDMAVWDDDHSGTFDVFAKNVDSGTPFPVVQGAGDQQNPAISGDLIVWQDNGSGNWDIYGARLGTDGAIGSPFPIATSTADETNPAVSGNLAAWQSTTAGRSDIVVEDLTSGVPQTVTDSSTTNDVPAVDGSVVIWQTAPMTSTNKVVPDGGAWDIAGDDMNDPGVFFLTNGGAAHINPAISGDLVVWQEYTTPAGAGPHAVGHWTISGASISTQQTFTVTDDPGDQTEPAISDGDVVYLQQDPGTLDSSIQGCGGNTVPTRRVRQRPARGGGSDSPISADACTAGHPRNSHRRVVWHEQPPSADYDVYGNFCTIGFSDVHPTDYFFGPVQALTCMGAVSGYGDNTFRPYNYTTRGQLSKIIVLSAGWAIYTSGGPHFTDVPPTNPFYSVVETAYHHGIISGYNCGGPGEPCDPNHRPYFRPNANVTRAQLSKIVVGAQGWATNTSGGPHFTDVPPSNPFYAAIETAYHHGIISGYGDGTFRWGTNATRGQIAKIVWSAIHGP